MNNVDHKIHVGISGWTYAPWRGLFYPKGLPQKNELVFASRQINAIEINGTFYRLQKPESYQKWFDETPAGFQFAIKGNRYITHHRRAKECDEPLANFFASGLLCLKEKLGPILWQFPPIVKLKDDRFEHFLKKLPHTHEAAAKLAADHTDKVAGKSFTESLVERNIRHAFEFRHPSFNNSDFIAMMREYNCAFVIADSGEKSPEVYDLTSDFVYVRMHGQSEACKDGYPNEQLKKWADRAKILRAGGIPDNWPQAEHQTSVERSIYFFFDNDEKK